jgi:hypothetical protein
VREIVHAKSEAATVCGLFNDRPRLAFDAGIGTAGTVDPKVDVFFFDYVDQHSDIGKSLFLSGFDGQAVKFVQGSGKSSMGRNVPRLIVCPNHSVAILVECSGQSKSLGSVDPTEQDCP